MVAGHRAGMVAGVRQCAEAIVGRQGAGPLERAAGGGGVVEVVQVVGWGHQVGRVEGLVGQRVVVVEVVGVVEGEGWQGAQSGGRGVAGGGTGLFVPEHLLSLVT